MASLVVTVCLRETGGGGGGGGGGGAKGIVEGWLTAVADGISNGGADGMLMGVAMGNC